MKLFQQEGPSNDVRAFDLYYSQALVVVALTDLECRSDQVPARALKLAKAAWEQRREFFKPKKEKK